MTLYATGSETRIAVVAETVPGTTPVTPTMTVLPVVKLDLELNQSFYEDASIYGDRMERNIIGGARKVTGSMSSNLSHTNFSSIIQTAMFSTWSSNIIKTGTALQTLTIEQWHNDLSKGFVYTGCFADKMKIKVPLNGIATIDSTINGFNMTTETTALQASPTAAVVEAPYVATTATLKEGGTTIAYLTAIDLDIDNGATALSVLGSVIPVGYTPGMSKVTGTITAWFPDFNLLNKFLNNTSSSIEFTLTDGTNTLDVLLPAVFYTGLKKAIQGQGAITLSLPFKAVRDNTTSSNVVITRS
jgi:Phage tail tube protein